MSKPLELELIENPDTELMDYFEKRLEEFNVARWEIKKKSPIAIKVTGSDGRIVAGVSGKTFGNWLLIDNLWVSEELRGQDYGTKILLKLEEAARNRGCKSALLDTLGFQARPFYEKHGYKVVWTQEAYPRDGVKFFMVKDLSK